jgi:hypothetical protein
MRKSLFGILFVFVLSLFASAADKLPPFTADSLPKKVVGPLEVGVPYTQIINYYGYVKPGAEPEEVVDGKKMFYIYVWIPAIAPEIGVRMLSPVSFYAIPKPKKTDFVDASYTTDGVNDTKNFFDTWVTFERAVEIINPADVEAKLATTKWIRYGADDDAGELPANPNGSKYNSQLKMVSEVSNPLKALIRGLYRIGFTTYKLGEVQGSFYAQIGAPVKIPGVIIEKDKAKLIELLKSAK